MKEQKELGRIKLSDTEDLVVSIVDDEKLDLRVWMNTKDYKGFTKRGVRFFLFDGNWDKFKGLVEKVDKTYQKVA